MIRLLCFESESKCRHCNFIAEKPDFEYLLCIQTETGFLDAVHFINTGLWVTLNAAVSTQIGSM